MKFGNLEVKWLGHASFEIKDGERVVYIDPYVLPENPEPADIILVTHEHFDHCAPEQIRKLQKGDTIVVTTSGASSKCPGNVRVVKPGDVLDIKGVRVTVVEAYNVNKQFHPRGLGVGFVIDIGGVKIYHAGDTDVIPEMADLAGMGIDLALLPVGGTYTMDIEDAIKAVGLIKPKAVIPMHYNYLEGLELSEDRLNYFCAKVKTLGIDCYLLNPEVS